MIRFMDKTAVRVVLLGVAAAGTMTQPTPPTDPEGQKYQLMIQTQLNESIT